MQKLARVCSLRAKIWAGVGAPLAAPAEVADTLLKLSLPFG